MPANSVASGESSCEAGVFSYLQSYLPRGPRQGGLGVDVIRSQTMQVAMAISKLP